MRINEEIRAREVRVNTDDGEQLGVMNVKDALKLAQERQLDLVEIVPNAKPPVCKIMDYGKYKYEQARKEKEAKKKAKLEAKKIVSLSYGDDDEDLPCDDWNVNVDEASVLKTFTF